MTAPYKRPQADGTIGNHQERIRNLEAVPPRAVYEIKVFSDTQLVVTGDGAFIFAIPDDLNQANLWSAAGYVTTVSPGGLPLLVQIRNVTTGNDMLMGKIGIDPNEFTSYTGVFPPEVNPAWSTVSTGDLLAIDVDQIGTSGAKGLGVMLTFF